MISYTLQTIVIQVLFVVVYEWILQRETFFQLNRAYLLIGFLFSFLIPVINWDILIPSDSIQILLPEIHLSNLDSGGTNSAFNWKDIVLWVWLLGAVFVGAKLLLNMLALQKLYRKGAFLNDSSERVIIVPNARVAFSFFNTIYIGSQIDLQDRDAIIKHEAVHTSQNHSLDLLLLEICKVFFWFNPLVYYYQNRLKRLHEFLADAEVIKAMTRKDYYERLLSQFFGTKNISFINTFFNHLLIQKRIVMLQKSKSNKRKLFNYLLVIPVMVGAIILVSCADTSANEVVERSEEQHLENTKTSDNPVSFYEIDRVPLYPGCEGLSNEEAKKCFSQNVSQFIANEFNTKVTSEDITGKQRIVVNFTITTEGNISEVKAKADFQELMDEAERVVKELPQMKPGQHQGKQVAVKFALPIIFEMEE